MCSARWKCPARPISSRGQAARLLYCFLQENLTRRSPQFQMVRLGLTNQVVRAMECFVASLAVDSFELYRAGQAGTDFETQEQHEVLDGVGDVCIGETTCYSVTSPPAQALSLAFSSPAPQA